MTVTTDQLHDALLEQVDSAPQPVGDLLTQVAEAENVDVPIVASAMWDLVEDGRVVYGTDAVVSPAS